MTVDEFDWLSDTSCKRTSKPVLDFDALCSRESIFFFPHTNPVSKKYFRGVVLMSGEPPLIKGVSGYTEGGVETGQIVYSAFQCCEPLHCAVSALKVRHFSAAGLWLVDRTTESDH